MSSVSYDAMVDQLTSMGFSREKAEAKARQEHPDVALARDAEAQRNARILESREQQVITNLARAIGFRVRSTSQYRAAKISPDFPDLWLTMEAIGFAGWWETKRQVGGKRSSGQIEFGEECLAARIPYGFGDRYEFARWLARRGFSVPPIPQD